MFSSVGLGGYNFTAEEQVLTDEMVKYWGNFAHTGNPNQGPGGQPNVQWPLYDAVNMPNLNLDLKIQQIGEIRTDYCDYWDSVGYFQAWLHDGETDWTIVK